MTPSGSNSGLVEGIGRDSKVIMSHNNLLQYLRTVHLNYQLGSSALLCLCVCVTGRILCLCQGPDPVPAVTMLRVSRSHSLTQTNYLEFQKNEIGLK
jgi:hypothetical protein